MTSNRLLTISDFLPKWRNFAKSGHTAHIKNYSYFNLVEFGFPVFDGSDPLLDGGLDALRRELLLGDFVVIARINSAK